MSEAATRGRSPLADAVSNSAEGIVVTQMLIVEDIERSIGFYRDVLGASVERDHAPATLRLHNAWPVLNVGGGPTSDKSDVTLTPPLDPNTVSGLLNVRVSDIGAVHALWVERSAKFLAEPSDRGPEIRCYRRDPDGYLIEVGRRQSRLMCRGRDQLMHVAASRKEAS
jgi:catechol 2,3-dioxygenase-like lactoylglutathione lyase family enzyme